MNKVTITVSGRVGSGKSAICGEIEILCRALGLKIEWTGGQEEKNLTHADWTEALEIYRPEVVIVEQIERAAPQPPAQADARVGLTDGQWYDLASRHANADWNGNGYLASVKALCGDYRTLLATPQPEPRAEVTEEQPSLSNPLTPYGMLVRALRIVAQSTLYDMAQSTSFTPAQLSAMEFGRTPVTDIDAQEIAAYFEKLGVRGTLPAILYAAFAARTGASS